MLGLIPSNKNKSLSKQVLIKSYSEPKLLNMIPKNLSLLKCLEHMRTNHARIVAGLKYIKVIQEDRRCLSGVSAVLWIRSDLLQRLYVSGGDTCWMESSGISLLVWNLNDILRHGSLLTFSASLPRSWTVLLWHICPSHMGCSTTDPKQWVQLAMEWNLRTYKPK